MHESSCHTYRPSLAILEAHHHYRGFDHLILSISKCCSTSSGKQECAMEMFHAKKVEKCLTSACMDLEGLEPSSANSPSLTNSIFAFRTGLGACDTTQQGCNVHSLICKVYIAHTL